MSVTPSTLDDVQTPCLLVNVGTVKRNAENMIAKCKALGLQLRPNMKTHKCLEVALLATGGTKRCITVSTLAEAEFFANKGFDDILYGALFTKDKIPRLTALANKLSSFHVLIDSLTALELLLDETLIPGRKWSIYLKVDVGSNRAGILWDDDEEAVPVARRISSNDHCIFQGVYAHESQTYNAHGTEEIKQIGETAAERILHLANHIRQAGITCRTVGLGATPSASHPSPLMKDLTELHPGNYLFYDVQQSMIGSCQVPDMAIRVASRIIGHYKHRNELLIDAGWTAMSLDGKGGLPNGSYCLFEDQPNLRLMKMSQEVGYIQPRQGKLDFTEYPIGMMLYLIPYHACATASMHSRYIAHSGTDVVGFWTPCRGW